MPFTGPADLVAKGWASAGAVVGDVPVVPLDLASAVLWLVVAGVAVSQLFRWEPRAGRRRSRWWIGSWMK